MKHLLLLALCLASFFAPAQSVYRCEGPGGQPVFQQSACPAGKGGAIEVRGGNVVDGNPAGEAALRAQADRLQAVRVAQARGQLIKGMTESEMQQVLGVAAVVNSDYFGGGVRQQHVYRDAGGSRYVYTENGVVTGLQVRPGLAAAKPRDCTSKSQTQDLQFMLGSVTRTAEEKDQLRQRLRAAQNAQCE